MGEGLKRANAAARATRTTPPLAAEIDRLRAELRTALNWHHHALIENAELKSLLGEASQAINTMLDLWAAHTSSPPASRADEIERALNRVRRAGARVGRARKERSDG